jgi:hypothetical protein
LLPRLVAISMEWMASEKRMSEMAMKRNKM